MINPSPDLISGISKYRKCGNHQCKYLGRLGCQGQEVYFGKEKNIGNTFKLQTYNLSEGVYFIKIQSKDGIGIRRFIKLK